jgi:hypothetical protein
MTLIANKHYHPSLQFVIFIAITIGVIGAGYLIGSAAVIAIYGVDALLDIARLNLASPATVNALWVLQIVSTTIPIIAASLIFAILVV